MIKASISLQELRRKIYIKAKADKQWRFGGCTAILRGGRSAEASVGSGGVGKSYTRSGDYTEIIGYGISSRKRLWADRAHNP